VIACSRELSGIGSGCAFVLLSWANLQQQAMQQITDQMLNIITFICGPIHCKQ
jgi:hypothetical protein